MLHVVGAVVVAELAVVPEADVQIVGIFDLIGGGDARAEGCEGVEGLAEPARWRPGRPGEASVASRRDVDHAGVAEHRLPPVLGLHPFGRPLDHQRQLGLVHEHPGLGELRQLDRVARPDHRVRVLHEHVERTWLALGVLPIVGDAGEDLAGSGQGRPQPHPLQRDGLALALRPLERRAQALEPVDDRGHGQLGRIADAGLAGDVDDSPVGEQPRQDRLPGRRLEQHQFHGVTASAAAPCGGLVSDISRGARRAAKR